MNYDANAIMSFLSNIHLYLSFHSDIICQYYLLHASATGTAWLSSLNMISNSLYNVNVADSDKPGLIIDLSVDTLRDNLIYLWRNSNKLKQMGHRGRNIMRQISSYSNICKPFE